jgi:hypothetical protein
MRWTNSQSWRPLVYLSTTLGAVGVVLALVYGIARLLIPGFSVVGIRRGDGRILIEIAGALAFGTVLATTWILKRYWGRAFGTVLATTWILKRYWGRAFGTYLDNPDADPLHLRANGTHKCRRCGTPFQVYSNDAHAAGFCSQACQKRGA